jgi:hypothetical protein
MTEVLDKSYNQETGELQQFLILDETGQPQLLKATPENILLHDPENELPLENGLHDVLNGDRSIVLQEDDPLIMVAPTNDNYCFVLRVGDTTVETTPRQSEAVLEGLRDALIKDDVSQLRDVFTKIISEQVRRDVIRAIMGTFDQQHRLSQSARGWLVDDFYLVNWDASMYTQNHDPDSTDYVRDRANGGVSETNNSREFVRLQVPRERPNMMVTIDGKSIQLTDREMLFLTKIEWLLHRRENHSDLAFWKWTDKYASVDTETGLPEQ